MENFDPNMVGFLFWGTEVVFGIAEYLDPPLHL